MGCVLPLGRRLQGTPMIVVKGVMQKEDVGSLQTEGMQLPAQLLEGVRAEPAGDQSADVLRAELHLDGAARMQRKGHVAHRPQVMADGAAAAVGPLHHRGGFPSASASMQLGQYVFPAIRSHQRD